MKKGKLALIIISGLIGISVIGNMLGASSNKTNNNANSKKQENESAKVEQKIEKTEEELKKEEEQKKREEEKLEEKRKLEQKELEEKNKINTAIGAATAAAAITNRNNNREEVRQERPAEEKRPKVGQAKVAERAVPSTQPKVNSNGREVYITPSGKKYHYDPQCGGKNSYKVGINSVGGRTPCQKCVH